MTPSLASPDPLLITIVLATLAIGLPIFFVMAIRFLWDRNLNVGRSKELEKLIWQLHRIASALEHQMNLSYPAVQPGTEEARDIAFLKQLPVQPNAAGVGAASAVAASVPPPVAQQPAVEPAQGQQPLVAPTAAEQPANPGLELRDPSVEAPRAGVNSMFGL
jgi:hypothetical protein